MISKPNLKLTVSRDGQATKDQYPVPTQVSRWQKIQSESQITRTIEGSKKGVLSVRKWISVGCWVTKAKAGIFLESSLNSAAISVSASAKKLSSCVISGIST